MDALAAASLVLLASVWAANRIVRKLRASPRDGCGSGCAACGLAPQCTPPRGRRR